MAGSNLEHTTALSEAVSCFYTLKAAHYEISGLVSRQTDLPPRRKSHILFYDLAAYFWGDKCNGKGEDG